MAGGALASLASWRLGFFINLPIAVVMIVLAARYLPRIRPVRGRFDLAGAVLSTIGMGALVYGIVNGGEQGWLAPLTLVPVVVGAVVLTAFVLNEWRARQPIMPLRLFASAERSGAAVARLLFAGAAISLYFFTTQFLQGVYGWSPLQTGLAFLPMTVLQFAASLTVARLSHRFGSGPVLTAGLVLLVAGTGWLSQAGPDVPYLVGIAAPMALIGLGQGLGLGPLTAAGIAGAAPADAGAASGLVNTAHQLGSTLGIAVLTTVGAGATTLLCHISSAYVGATVMFAAALVATIVFIVPAEARRRRASR